MFRLNLSVDIRLPVLLAVAALAVVLFLASPRPAHALVCDSSVVAEFGGAFTDCSGTENFYGQFFFTPAVGHLDDEGFLGGSWFSDLHITFDAVEVVSIEGGEFIACGTDPTCGEEIDPAEWDVGVEALPYGLQHLR